ncbi:hypothetical protein PR003_g24425 [Phytophthora rubi]|uniref:Tim44-like domain-containing protein n=1 Tax=Phytophthora rubi TaxID=129364 RepID=A0A6A3I6M3_9STRA|nr:hypothetical protein PR001_g25631 [Phytophthora rubi]KAE9002035.1 hypothetical protein PR002_g17742 [Phytophthora rubi]KAE9293767.1 hypothetical protein PR003_g24425 [Phytophthora rubi]
MVQLHMPAQTHVELPEFLEGAKAASKAYLKAILSKEFSHFAAGLTHESAAAAELAAYCTPQDYDLWKRAMAYMVKDTNMTLDLLDVELQSAAVASVRYVQLTQTEYEAQTAGPTTLPWLWAPDATIEYMQIRVTTRSLDTMKITLTGQGERVVLQDNTHTWTFGSKVGSPDELDWRIVATGDKNNDEKTLSHTVYADEADDTREKEALDSEEKA